jgi:hypothetical protein
MTEPQEIPKESFDKFDTWMNQIPDIVTGETVIHAGNWKIPLRHLQAWSFTESASGYIINYVVTGIGMLANTTYAKTEKELDAYLTKLYGNTVAKYLMEGHAQNG